MVGSGGVEAVLAAVVDELCGCLVSWEGGSIVMGMHGGMSSGGGGGRRRIDPTELLTIHRHWGVMAAELLASNLRLSNQLSRWEGERTIKPIGGNRATDRLTRARRAGGEAVFIRVRDQYRHSRLTRCRTSVAEKDCAP